MCDRRLSIFLVDRHLFPVGRMSADRSIDRSFIVFYNAIYNTAVSAIDTVLFDLLCNFNMALIIFTYNERTGCVHIDPVHDSWPYFAINARKTVFAVKHNRIN